METINQFCSNNFYCENCLSKEHKIVNGYTRYDSLVLCQKHNEEFKPIMQKLNDVFDSIPNKTVIKDLGL